MSGIPRYKARLVLVAVAMIGFANVVQHVAEQTATSVATRERHVEFDLSLFGARAHFSTSVVRAVAD